MPRVSRQVFEKDQADLVGKVLSMHHTDLPKMLAKEYWYGQNQRLNYMERVGDLWDTRAIVELASDAFKTLRISLMLVSDTVEREVGLTEAQREIIDRMMRTTLETMREKLVDALEQNRRNSGGKAFTQSAEPVSESGGF